MQRRQERAQAGFTLVELIVVIVIAGILAALGGQLIVKPITGYVDLARRTRLVDEAEMALRRMQRDVRQALPNSIRIAGGGQYLELLHTVDGGRYRRYLGATGGDVLDFSSSDSRFDVLGSLRTAPAAGQQLAIYNIAADGTEGNAYAAAPDNLTPIGSGSSVSHINLSAAFQFAHRSPYQRFFIVDQAVTYACEGGVLNRYAGYSLTSTQQTPPAGTPALVTRGVSECRFSYDPGAAERAGLMTLSLALSEAGETIRLLHQVHVVNAP